MLAYTYMCPGVAHATDIFENRRFKYKELKLITNGFKNVIGKGGFGPVYMGCLENGTSVAVKMRSQSSSQGNKEFLAEVCMCLPFNLMD
jgi:hypothetical protein